MKLINEDIISFLNVLVKVGYDDDEHKGADIF